MERDFQTFLENGQDVGEIVALENLFQSMVTSIGFKHFSYFNVLTRRTGPPQRIFDDMPGEWWAYLRDTSLQPDEMGVQELLNATIPVHLDDAQSLKNGRGPAYVAKCLELGLDCPVAVPLRGGLGESYAVIFYGRNSRLTLSEVVMLQAVCKRFHIWHKRLVKEAVPKAELTPKQIEYLVLTSHGNTAAEVAKLSGVSVNAVRHSIDSAFERLGVQNVHGAIARAISYNLLQGHFDIEHLAGEKSETPSKYSDEGEPSYE